MAFAVAGSAAALHDPVDQVAETARVELADVVALYGPVDQAAVTARVGLADVLAFATGHMAPLASMARGMPAHTTHRRFGRVCTEGPGQTTLSAASASSLEIPTVAPSRSVAAHLPLCPFPACFAAEERAEKQQFKI